MNKPVERRKQQVVSEIPVPDVHLRYTAHQFRYLVNTRHYDDEDGGEWETMRVVPEGDNIVVYRRQVIGKGTKLGRNEDEPIFALDVAHMTQLYNRKVKAKTAA